MNAGSCHTNSSETRNPPPTRIPEAIQPIVPRVRTGGASFSGFSAFLEEERIDQSQGRHVADEMEKQPKEEIVEVGSLGSQIEKESPQQMKNSDHDLSRKKTVRDHSDDERGNHGRYTG